MRLAVLATFAVILSVTAVVLSEDLSSADTETEGVFKYELISDGQVTYAVITGNTITSCQPLEIPSSLGGYDVVAVDAGAFEGCTHIVSVKIPSTVRDIGDKAFYGCTSLFEVVNLSGHLAVDIGSESNGYVGYYAMNVFTSVDEATVDTSTDFVYGNSKDDQDADVYYLIKYKGDDAAVALPTDIGGGGYTVYYRAFEGCTGVKSVTFNDNVLNIWDYAFSGCTRLTSVTIPDSTGSVGAYAFSGCTSLSSITFGAAVESVGEYVCSGCTSLEAVIFDSSPAEIGSHAFSGCTKLSSVDFSDAVTVLGEYAFSGCTKLS